MADKVEVVESEVVETSEVATVDQKNEVAAVNNNSQMLSVNPFESKQSFNEYYKMAQYLASSDLVPASYKGKPMNCVIALEQAQRMNVSPMFVMQNLYIVQNRPVWSGSACAMLVNGSGLFRDVKLNYVGEKGTDSYGAFVSAVRTDSGDEVIGTTVDMAMAKRFGWAKNTMWVSMPEQMIGYRAYSMFARLHCPNALNGFATEGEIEDIESTKAKHTTQHSF